MNGREARESGLRLKACIADLPATAILCGPSPQSGGLEAIGQNPQKQPQRQMGGTSLHVGTKGALGCNEEHHVRRPPDPLQAALAILRLSVCWFCNEFQRLVAVRNGPALLLLDAGRF
jgi:hypothetical protein